MSDPSRSVADHHSNALLARALRRHRDPIGRRALRLGRRQPGGLRLQRFHAVCLQAVRAQPAAQLNRAIDIERHSPLAPARARAPNAYSAHRRRSGWCVSSAILVRSRRPQSYHGVVGQTILDCPRRPARRQLREGVSFPTPMEQFTQAPRAHSLTCLSAGRTFPTKPSVRYGLPTLRFAYFPCTACAARHNMCRHCCMEAKHVERGRRDS